MKLFFGIVLILLSILVGLVVFEDLFVYFEKNVDRNMPLMGWLYELVVSVLAVFSFLTGFVLLRKNKQINENVRKLFISTLIIVSILCSLLFFNILVSYFGKASLRIPFHYWEEIFQESPFDASVFQYSIIPFDVMNLSILLILSISIFFALKVIPKKKVSSYF